MDVTTHNQIGVVYRSLKEIADGTSHDLTLRQLLVLLAVGSKTTPTSQQELAERADEYKSTISKIIGVLAGSSGDVRRSGLGMLSVDLDPADLRNRVVSLSSDGEKVLKRAIKQAFKEGSSPSNLTKAALA